MSPIRPTLPTFTIWMKMATKSQSNLDAAVANRSLASATYTHIPLLSGCMTAGHCNTQRSIYTARDSPLDLCEPGDERPVSSDC